MNKKSETLVNMYNSICSTGSVEVANNWASALADSDWKSLVAGLKEDGLDYLLDEVQR